MTWWCSAQGTAWSWTWQPYPGVWLMIAALVTLYWRAGRRLHPEDRATAAERGYFVGGVATLWVAADWPIGALGAGYLLSVHQIQFVLFVLVAPALLLLGTPREIWRRALRRRWVAAVARILTRPVVLLIAFNGLVIATHFPELVDGWMRTQLGSFALDALWVGAGLALWWPVINPVPEFHGMGYGGRFAYLLGALVLTAAPAAFLIFANYPLYALYELAPPVAGIRAAEDQLVGGLIMKLGTGVAVFTAASILFYQWYRAEGRDDRDAGPPRLPEDHGRHAGSPASL